MCGIASVGVSGCSPPGQQGQAHGTRELAVEPPIRKATLRDADLAIHLVAGADLSELIAMDLFGPFRPNTPLSAIEAAQGPPETQRTGSEASYFGYRADGVRIEIAYVKEESPLAGRRETWSVYAYPQLPLSEVLRGQLQALVRQHSEVEKVIVMKRDQSTREGVAVRLGDHGPELHWYLID
jgi:hypothetical protein